MKNLLVVDWDYFFKVPQHPDPDWSLYDWGHKETPFFIGPVWVIRAATFMGAKGAVPTTTGEERDFWSKFKFSPTARIYVSDSNSYSASQVLRQDTSRVVLFDAHHDSGYGGGRVNYRKGIVTCDNWMMHYSKAHRTVVFPDWLNRDMWGTPEQSIYMATTKDYDFTRHTFDAVHVCRSGAWVPPWLDQDFITFVNGFRTSQNILRRFLLPHSLEPHDYPYKAMELRKFNPEDVQRHVDMIVETMASTKERKT